MVEAHRLRKSFTRSLAVDDVSFRLGKGEILGLIGPNGAGKTTTIRMVLNILKPDSGEVRYHGSPFSEQIRNTLGYLPEERGLYKKSQLLDTIIYFGQLRGMRKAAADEQALKWLRSFDLEDQRKRKIEELSKGNQQKVQFIVAVLHDPWLVVLDEPFAGLDPLNQNLMQETITGLRNEGKAVILSTHQMDYAEKLSDMICLVNDGKVLLRGTVPELKKRYGANTLRLEFSGDASVLTTLPGIKRVTMFPSGAECELLDEGTTGTLLGILSRKLNLRKFELMEPTLQSIFLDVVHKEAPFREAQRPAMKKILVIAAWEYLERVKSKFFLVSLVLMPLIMISLGILPAILVDGETQRSKVVAVADLTGDLLPLFADRLTDRNRTSTGDPLYIIRPIDVPDPVNEAAIRMKGDQLVMNGEVDGFCLITVEKTGRFSIEYRSSSMTASQDKEIFREALRSILLNDVLTALGVPASKLDWLDSSVVVDMVILSSEGGMVEEYDLAQFLNVFFTAYVFLMMLFFMILSSGQLLVRSVVEEKANRIVEILVSACTPTQLMTGKMLGLSALGFTQMLVWSGLGFLISSALSLEFVVPEQLLLLFLYFVLGFLLYASIFVAVGSPVTTEQEAQQVTGYLVIFLVIPLVLTVPAIQNPGAEWISILSYVPLLTPTMMGLRLALGTPSLTEIVTTAVIMVVSIYFSMVVAGRIFRVAILSTGKRPTMKELISWVRTGG